MITTALPLYTCFEQENLPNNPNFKEILETDNSFMGPLSGCPVDFAIRAKSRSWQEVGETIGRMVAQMVLFPWGIYELVRYGVQRVAMIALYPAQSRLIKWAVPDLRTEEIERFGAIRTIPSLKREGFIVRPVVLEHSGTRYSGLMIGHETTISNGRWALQATGNGEPIEYSAPGFARSYRQSQCNVLLVNGPSVGRSEGHATPKSMGEAQEVGLSFLETAVKANKIVIAGRSLGGAAVGQAVLKHQFLPNVQYLVARQMTFDRTSTIAPLFLERIVPGLFRYFPKLHKMIAKVVVWCGCEMDNVAASRLLQEKQIQEVIVQGVCSSIVKDQEITSDLFTDDGVIPEDATLGKALVEEENSQEHRTFAGIYTSRRTATHMMDPIEPMRKVLDQFLRT